jgi:uroporphyrinogen-III decarboxylase
MTNREIMKVLLNGEQPDITPQWLMAFSSKELMKSLVGNSFYYNGYGQYPDSDAYPFASIGTENLQKELDFNKRIDRIAFPIGWGASGAFGHGGPGEFNKRIIASYENYYIVEYETGAKKEVRLKPHNVHTFDLPIKEQKDLDKLELPDPEAPARYEGLKEDISWAKEHGEWTVGWVNGFFSGLHYFLRDYMDVFMDLAGEPEFMKRMIARLGDWNLKSARMLCEAGVDCIGICDDLGSEKNMLLSPDMYHEFFWPWHKKLCDIVHEYDAVVHMHSHGAIMPVVPLLAEAGVDILNPVDPDDGMPMAEVREAAGPKIVLCGGMNKHFFDWNRDKQIEHLRYIVKSGRSLGPHILMDSGGIPDNVTREWFDWFIPVSREIRSQS